jgi:hypothetical protein
VVAISLVAMTASLGALGAPAEAGGAFRFGAPTRVFSRNLWCCFEPSVAVDRSGRVFITDAAGDGIAVSSDEGAHFTQRRVPPELVAQSPLEEVRAPMRGQRCVCDAIVQIDPRGRLVYSTLADTGIQVAVSSDAAKSWDSNTIIRTALHPDRQWIGFGPKDAVYVIWHSGVFVSQVGIGTPAAFFTSTSLDGGRTFGPPQPFLPGTDIFSVGPPVVDGAGRVYVPVMMNFWTGDVVEGALAVAVSPGGVGTASFVAHKVTTEMCFCGFPIAAVDTRSTVAVAYSFGQTAASLQTRVSRSTDHGRSWSPPRAWSDRPVNTSPWIEFRGGRADVLWYGGGDVMLTRGAPNGSGLHRTLVAAWGGPPRTHFAHFAYLRDGRLIAVFSSVISVYASTELPLPSGTHR